MKTYYTVLLITASFLKSTILFAQVNEVVPNSFKVIIPLKYNHKKYFINLTCEKNDDKNLIISNAISDVLLPKKFYTILLNDFL